MGITYFVFIIGSIIATTIFFLAYNRHWRQRHGVGGPVSVKQLAAALHDEKMKSSIIVNAIEDGVILLDSDGMIRSFNAGAGKITGWESSDSMNLDFHSIIHIVNDKGQPYEDATNPLHRVFVEGVTIRDNTASLLTKSRRIIALNMTVSPLLDEQKRVFAAVAVFRDVTEERVEETQRAEFISTASHEMRTPVAAIEGYLSLALNSNVSTIDSRARDYLEKAHTSTTHLGKLFQDLLTSAKAEDGRLTSHPVVVEMGDYLQHLTEDLKFVAEKKHLATEFLVGTSTFIDASTDNGKVIKPLYYSLADPDRLREVVTNIFDNAVKYTDQGKISIGLTGNNQVVQLYVKDTGPGINSEDLPHLFQKFYRVDNSATRTIGGTGLGLFISRKIIELYHGRIWAESEVGKGTTFFINLPRLTSQQAAQMQNTEASKQALPAITSLASS
jgi:two-component system sensor histidine kinase VicK